MAGPVDNSPRDARRAARPIMPAARPATPPAAADPLSPEHHRLLRQAAAARRPIRRAARVARSSAITILAIGTLGVPFLIFWPSWLGLLVVVGIATVGIVEYVGARRMRRGEPTAAAFLGRNQLAFMGLIAAYCILQMLTFSPEQARAALDSSDLQEVFSLVPEMRQDVEQQVQQWVPVATYGFYSLVILLSLGFQGSLALYYFTRRRHLEAVHQSTPEWIRRLFRELDV